jgi:hypothetical protein
MLCLDSQNEHIAGTVQMIDHVPDGFCANSASRRQALINVVLQELERAVARMRSLHCGGNEFDLSSATSLGALAFPHVILGVEHRLLDTFGHRERLARQSNQTLSTVRPWLDSADTAYPRPTWHWSLGITYP